MSFFKPPIKPTLIVQKNPLSRGDAPRLADVDAWAGRWQALLVFLTRANELAYVDSREAFHQQALELIRQAAQAESAIYFRLDDQTDELVVAAVSGDDRSQHLVGLRFKRRDGVLDAILHRSDAAVVGELPEAPRWLRAAQPEAASRLHNVIGLNLECRGQMLGVVQLYNYRSPDLELLDLLCERLALEIERRETLENERRSNQKLRSLIDALGQVAGMLDRSQLLRLVTEQVSRLVGAERSSLFLVDPDTQEMIFQVAYQSAGRQSPAVGANSPAFGGEPTRPRTGARRNSQFSYFSRSAITVPITAGPRSPAQADDAPQTLGGLMALNSAAAFEQEDMQVLEILAEQTSTFLQVAELYESTGELMLGAIKALAAAIDAKDPYTQGHSQRVSDYSVMIAQELGLDEGQVHRVRIGSLLHDVGKIGMPDAILKKPGRLTPAEYIEIQKHPLIGMHILKDVKMLEPMLPAVVEHHERLNGLGYPYGLRNEQISLLGRIVAVADVFDAITSHRPYRAALSVAEGLAYLKNQSGILFDADCVLALKTIVERANDLG